TCRLTCKPQIPVTLVIELKSYTATPAERPGLTLAVLFGNAVHLQSRERLHIPDECPIRCGNQHHLIFHVERSHHILDAWVVPTRFGIDCIQQGDAIRRSDFGLCPLDWIEISRWALADRHRNGFGSAR